MDCLIDNISYQKFIQFVEIIDEADLIVRNKTTLLMSVLKNMNFFNFSFKLGNTLQYERTDTSQTLVYNYRVIKNSLKWF